MIVEINSQNIQKAKAILEKHWIIALPTETVYWLWANAESYSWVLKLFKIKKRPLSKAISVLFYAKDQIKEYCTIKNKIEKDIINHFMPWSITLLLKKKKFFFPNIISNNWKLWVRIPEYEPTLKILKWIWYPIAAPSANPTWLPPATNAKQVANYFWTKIPIIFDWWESPKHLSSTVLEVINWKIKIRRQWPITEKDLQNKFPKVEII